MTGRKFLCFNFIFLLFLFSTVRCGNINPDLFTKVFIDDRVEVANSADAAPGLLQRVAAMPMTDFCDLMARMYFLRCNTLNPTLPVPINCSCGHVFETNTDFSPFLDRLTTEQMAIFVKLPPGRLRQEMFHRLSDSLTPELFDSLRDAISDELPFQTQIVKDLIPLFNKYIDTFGIDELIGSLPRVAYENIVGLTLPVNYRKIRQLAAEEPMDRHFTQLTPFPGTEQHFTISAAKKNVPALTGREFSVFNQLDLIENRPFVLIDGGEEMREEWAESFLNGLKRMMLEKTGHLVDFSSLVLRSYVDKALGFLENDDEKKYFRYLFSLQSDVDSSSTGIVNLGSETFINELNADTCTNICRFVTIPSNLTKSQQRSVFSSGPANPRNFLNILTRHYRFGFFQALHNYGQYLSEAERKAVRWVAKVAYGEEPFARMELRINRTRLLNQSFNIWYESQSQEYLLHSLHFKIGAFQGLDDSVQTAYESIAFIFFPDICCKLKAVRKRLGIRPNVEDLLDNPFVNQSWLLEFYCTKDPDRESPQSFLRLANSSRSRSQSFTMFAQMLNVFYALHHSNLPTIARLLSLGQFVAEATGNHDFLNRLLEDLQSQDHTLYSLLTLKDGELIAFAKSRFGLVGYSNPLLLPLFVFVWEACCGDKPVLCMTKSLAISHVQRFFNKLVTKEYHEDDYPMIRTKHFKLMQMLAESRTVRLDMFLEGIDLLPMDLITLFPDSLIHTDPLAVGEFEGMTPESTVGFNLQKFNPLVSFRVDYRIENVEDFIMFIMTLFRDGMSANEVRELIKEYYESIRLSSGDPSIDDHIQQLDTFINGLPRWIGKQMPVDERTSNLCRPIKINNLLLMVHPDSTGAELYILAEEQLGMLRQRVIRMAENQQIILDDDNVIPLGLDIFLSSPV